MKNRIYQPSTGRFLTEDPIRDGLNYYTYCKNNPLFFLDPFGLAAIPATPYLEKQGISVTWNGNYVVNGVTYAKATATFNGQLDRVFTGPVDPKTNRMMVEETVISDYLKYVDSQAGALGYHPVRDGIAAGVTVGTVIYGGGLVVRVAGPAVSSAVGTAAAPIIDKASTVINTISNSACFISGTKIMTLNGFKQIEDVCIGDMVYSQNADTGENGLKKVVRTFVNQTNNLVYLQIAGDEIVTTSEHPFYVMEKGWVNAYQLKIGDKLIQQSGKIIILEDVHYQTLEDPIIVYNFEVEDWHTYYVSNCSVLVHNACNFDPSAIIKNINQNSAHHIMQEKHAWDLVGANDWSGVSNVINTVLTKGSGVANNVGNVVYSYNYGGQTVDVITRVVNGATRVVDAWVRTR